MTSTKHITILSLIGGLLMAQGNMLATELYVSPKGSDSARGTIDASLATLPGARDRLRQLRADKKTAGDSVIHILPGVYELDAQFQLTAQDGGNPDERIIYRATETGKVHISGGRKLPATAFVPVTDERIRARLLPEAQDIIRVCDLRKLGIENLGTISREALNGGPMLEIFFNDQAMRISRWPDAGWATYGEVLDPGSVPRWKEKPDRPGTLTYTDDRPERWTQAPEIWLHGYWAFDWYDDVLKVATLDTEQKRITFTTPHTYGLKSKKRYAALNLLEELSTPGEYVIDYAEEKLYIIPPAPIENAQIHVSTLDKPLILLEKASHVTIEGMLFEFGRDSAVQIRGGTDNLIASCTIRNMGRGAIAIGPAESKKDGYLTLETGDEILDGRRNGVVGCDIYNVGTSGISLTGGDRRSLASGGLYAVNNDIHHYSRRKRTGCPAVGLNGVGNRAAHNAIHDAPHCGINYGGNDHIIEYNEAYNLCWETGDVGIIYTGRNWTTRGNVVRYNFIHHIDAPGQVGSMGVYLDDSHSSTTIYGNVFYRTHYAAFIGGGRDNVVENNIFIDCKHAVHLDNRSQGWAHKYQVPGGDHRMYAKLKEVHYDQPPYSERYPELARILDENPHEPRGNKVLRNICVRGNWLHVFKDAEEIMDIRDNWATREDPGFVDADAMDFSLKSDAPAFAYVPGFQPIPFREIGLQRDAYRKALPPKAPRIVPDGGVFTDPITVHIETNAPDATIRYTLDGSTPIFASIPYEKPVTISSTSTLLAAVFPRDDSGAIPVVSPPAKFTHIEFGEGRGVYLSDLKPLEVFSHGGLKKGTNYRGNDFITLSGNACQKGSLLHPEKLPEGGSTARAVYAIEGILVNAKRFKALVGIDDGSDERGSVSFKVEARKQGTWVTLIETKTLHGPPNAEQITIDVDISGADQLRISNDGGNDVSADHAAWGYARLE